jgi:hypothetical protein
MENEPQMDAALERLLKDFRSSVHAWSEAAYDQPHKPVKIYRTSWRLTASWALGCVLAIGSVAGGMYERHHVNEQEKISAAAEAARQQKLDELSKESEDLLAKVDSDVSREVPSAMEPLAQLMAEDTAE